MPSLIDIMYPVRSYRPFSPDTFSQEHAIAQPSGAASFSHPDGSKQEDEGAADELVVLGASLTAGKISVKVVTSEVVARGGSSVSSFGEPEYWEENASGQEDELSKSAFSLQLEPFAPYRWRARRQLDPVDVHARSTASTKRPERQSEAASSYPGYHQHN